MRMRIAGLFVATMALGLVMEVCARADDKTHEGTVVKVEKDKLTMADKDKKEHSHTVPKDAKVTCDGKECKLEDLKKGYTVKVTVEKKGDKNEITKIEAKKN